MNYLKSSFLILRKRVPNATAFRRCKNTMGDPIEHATGLEKRELLSKLAGNENPFEMKTLKRGPGTRTQPTEIPSAFDQRLIGCICDEESVHINWMWLIEGQCRRCECGHWFKLVKTTPL